MRVMLELVRIILIFGLLGSFFMYILTDLYGVNAVTSKYRWIAGLGIYVFLFVLYRNRWQFSGWYHGKGRKKLPQVVTYGLSGCAALLVVSPFLLRLFLS
ncbi:hypothetical protein GCM10010954_23110 [Halobacillus andaensis]|uniref:Uncharacterized protein n=1 Tax=Halobacillus andaensis TaxID=1176239 RepID=A0A917B5Q1_HALAA|nr:hypothetical protein [Halobacillus andaensis]MBP2006098.1 hypothetical protein [Halobacillus andaensis]GGF23667.1 hypothetical protein GCM10010954_23110 [Halobacillus andaensis]